MNKINIIRATILLPILNFGCQSKEKEAHDANDYFRVQGIVTDVQTHFNHTKKFQRELTYTYGLGWKFPKTSTDGNSKLLIHNGEPIVVMVKKSDSTDSFIAYRGIFDRKELKKIEGMENILRKDPTEN